MSVETSIEKKADYQKKSKIECEGEFKKGNYESCERIMHSGFSDVYLVKDKTNKK